MKNRDLHSIIKDMAARLDQHHSASDAPGALNMLTEVEAYMAVDATLARLYKEFADARQTRLQALTQHGAQSAFADIAADLEESAQSAMETRMIELREDQIKRSMVERMMAHAHIAQMDDYRAERAQWYAERQATHFAEQRYEAAMATKRRQEGEDSFMTLMVMWWLMRQMVQRTQTRLSLAHSFARARAPERDYDYAASAA
ncbi:MAG TPA: hypothetical protein VGD95_01310 [Micavibrio sp.]